MSDSQQILRVVVSDHRTFWGHGPIWWTSMDNNPHEVMLDDLDEDTQSAIKQALRAGHLLQVDKAGNIVRQPVQRQEKPEIQVFDNENIELVEQTEEEIALKKLEPMMQYRLKEVMSGTVDSVRREIDLMQNVEFLKAAVAIEKQRGDRTRKSVLKLLDKAIDKYKSKGNTEHQLANQYLNAITEGDQEEIEITRTSIELNEDDSEAIEVPMAQQTMSADSR